MATTKSYRTTSITRTYDLLAALLTARGLQSLGGVTGGGINHFLSILQMSGVEAVNAASELDGVGFALAKGRRLKPGFSGTFSTHGAGIVQQADIVSRLSDQAMLPTIAIIGGNKDGKTGPTDFQSIGDLQKRYGGMYKHIFDIRRIGGKFSPEKEKMAGELIKMLNEAHRNGEPVLLSVPNNLGNLKVNFPIGEEDYAMATSSLMTEPEPLSADAEAKLDELVEQVNKDGSRVLFALGEGMGHAIRLGGRDVIDLSQEVMGQIVGNRIVSVEWPDLFEGHEHELTVASHNFGENRFKAVNQCNTVICLGVIPDASMTGIGKEATYKRGKKVFVIDTREEYLERYRKDPNAPEDLVTIKADPRAALEYLNGKQYDNRGQRTEEAKRIANELRVAVEQGSELPRAEQMLELHSSVAGIVESFGSNVGTVVSSGDDAGTYLAARKNQGKAGNTFYPGIGELGLSLGAADAFLRADDIEKVVALFGDGEARYSNHYAHLAEEAHRSGKSTVLCIYDNEAHGAVDKGGNTKPDPIREKILEQDRLPAFRWAESLKAGLEDYNANVVRLEGTQPGKVAQAFRKAMEHPGLSVLHVNTKNLAKDPGGPSR